MSEKKTKRIVLLDSHAIIHRAYHALPGFATSEGEPTGALYGLSTMLMKAIADLKPDYIIACYDLPQKTFRHEAYVDYKAGRAKTDEELISQIKRSREIFKSFSVPIYDAPGFEADDLLGTIVDKLKNDKNIEIVIVSGDMDTMQLVSGKKVQVYTLKKGINDTILYDEDKVVERFGFGPKSLPDYKGLRGDPSDNIIGIKGIGEKTATTLIQKFGTIEKMYEELATSTQSFKDAGITDRIIELLKNNKDEAIFSKVLAFIRPDAPINFSLPQKVWKEEVNIKEVAEVFKKFQFKSLVARAENLFNQKDAANLNQEPASTKGSGVARENISEDRIKKVGIAVWLLDSSITTPSQEEILKYAKTEFFDVAEKKILEEIKEKKLEYVYEKIELPLIPVLEKAEDRGVLIDSEYLEKLSEFLHKDIEKLEREIYALADGPFNINSPKQMGEMLFDKMRISVTGLKKTAGGERSTRESELAKLAPKYPIIRLILEYREIQKILSTYVDPIPKLADKNGRLHTRLNQAGTTTGRMSSQNPNLQNIPIRGQYGEQIRRGFVAEKGFSWIASDYSQIEMRVLALFSEDKNLTNVFKKGGDVHTATAALIFGISEDDVTKEMRRSAKTINFGIIYGMGVNSLRASLGVSREEAQNFYDNYFKAFPNIKKYFENVKFEVSKKGYTETLFGRRRYFEAIKSKIPYLRAMAERASMNAPLQGTAADIIKIATIRIDEEIEKRGWHDKVFLLLAVHDELIYEVRDELVEEASPVIKMVMENAVESRIPFDVNISIGKSWANA